MPPRSRYAVDPSLQQGQQPGAQQYGQHLPPQQYGQHLPPQQYGQPQQSLSRGPSPAPQMYGGAAPQQHFQQQQPAYAQQQQQQFGQPQPHHAQQQFGQPQQYGQQPQMHVPPSTFAPAGQMGQQYGQPAPHHQQQFNYPPQNHIAQPPHSTGPTLTGARVRIDPSQMPDPIEAQELDQNLYDDEDFLSCDTKGLIPLAGTDYRGVDQGNSLPRHLRPSLPTIPATHQLLDTTALPFGLVVQPFAALRYDEAPIPLVSNWVAGESAFDIPRPPSGEDEIGPPRCEKCRAYINPWIRWTDGGRKWACNLCGGETPVSHAYFAHLAPTGQRIDQHERPELLHGTVDFAVPPEYWFPQPAGSILEDDDLPNPATDALATTGSDLLGALQQSLGQTPTRGPTPTPSHKERLKKEGQRKYRRPVPLGRVFVLDVSTPAVQRGIVREVCEAIRRGIYGEKKESEDENEDDDEPLIGKGERVAFITVGQGVGFWNLAAALSSPQLLVVSDLEDMYTPLHSGFLVDPVSSRSQVEQLLTLIPNMYEAQPDGPSCAIGAAIKGALCGLRSFGGQINFFLSGLPVLGPGKLKPREEQSLAGTDKEKTLFAPNDPFWRVTADELAECGVGVNTFVFPDQACDLASVGILSATTGGEMFFHPKFNPVRDRDALSDEIKRVIVRETAYNATVRIRCSNGLRISEHTGAFYQRSLTDLEIGTLDENKAFTATIKHEGHKLDDRQMAYVQVATLYTSASGERRVRVLNASYQISGLIGNVFRFADFDASVVMLYKEAVVQLSTKSLRDIRKHLIEKANRILLMYRKHCAPAVQAGQLILPESFKMLPLYTLCMTKSKALKGGNVVPDVRVHYKRLVLCSSTGAIQNLLYPRMLAIHDLAESTGFPGDNGRLKLPRFMRLSYNYMVPEGAYLLSNGEMALLWFGHSVSPQILDDLYGVQNLDELDTRMTRLPKLPTLLSTQVRNILTHLERLAGRSLPVLPVRQERDGLEIEFANQLYEDSNNDALSYADYLMSAHKAITNEISGRHDGWKAPWS